MCPRRTNEQVATDQTLTSLGVSECNAHASPHFSNRKVEASTQQVSSQNAGAGTTFAACDLFRECTCALTKGAVTVDCRPVCSLLYKQLIACCCHECFALIKLSVPQAVPTCFSVRLISHSLSLLLLLFIESCGRRYSLSTRSILSSLAARCLQRPFLHLIHSHTRHPQARGCRVLSALRRPWLFPCRSREALSFIRLRAYRCA